MVGKRIQLDEETWEAIVALSKRESKTFQQAFHLPGSPLAKKKAPAKVDRPGLPLSE
jgi:hypothetical protein